jgi:hypothetical protein
LDNKNIDGACGELEYKWESTVDSDKNHIVMVDRGDCSFVQKARNVQKAGGHVALIINNEANVKPETVLMVDDGTGSDILIPAILISREDGEKIKQYMRENRGNKDSKVVMDVEFEIVI